MTVHGKRVDRHDKKEGLAQWRPHCLLLTNNVYSNLQNINSVPADLLVPLTLATLPQATAGRGPPPRMPASRPVDESEWGVWGSSPHRHWCPEADKLKFPCNSSLFFLFERMKI